MPGISISLIITVIFLYAVLYDIAVNWDMDHHV